MKHNLLCTLLLASITLTGCGADAAKDQTETLVTIESALDVKQTADKLNTIIQSKGLTLFSRIDHADNAKNAGLELRPTELIIFGNPKVGTPLMKCSQTTAIDLPQKMLIWQGEQGKTWLSYNKPSYLKSRHTIEGCDKVIGKIEGVLGALSMAATSK